MNSVNMVWHRVVFGRFTSVVLICLTAIMGDSLVSINSNNRFYKALCDNLTHGAIGAITWGTAAYFAGVPRWQEFDIALCTALSMIIDVDHFAAARSFRIEDASSLSHRPPLHCTTMPIVLFVVGNLLAVTTKSYVVGRYTCLVGGAFFSHHFRDAARRGLWLWPFGSTPPFPPWLYFSSVALLPHMLALLMNNLEGTQKLHNAYLPVQSV